MKDRSAWIWALIATHIGKFFYWFQDIRLSGEFPILNYDFIQYYARLLRMNTFLSTADRIWGYDPYQMAGYISGPFLSVGTTLFGVLTYWLSPLLSVKTSLLIMEMAGYLLAPFCAVFFARLMGATRNQSWVAFAIVLLHYGHMERMTLQLVHVGLFGYQMAVFVGILQVGLLWNWIQTRKWGAGVLLVLVSSLLFQIHPAALLIVFVPNAIAYVQFFSSLKKVHHAFVCFGLLVVTALNWYWIEPFFAFSHWMDRAPYFQSEGFPLLFHTLSPIQDGWFFYIRMIFHWALIWLSMSHLMLLWRQSRPMAVFLTGWIGWMGLVGYFGSYLPLLKSLQPGRILIAFWILLGVISAFSFQKNLWQKKYRREGILVLVGFVALLVFDRPKFFWNRFFQEIPAEQEKVVKFLKDKAPLEGRVLITCSDRDKTHFSDLIPYLTGVSVLGGPHPGNFLKARSTLFAENYWDGRKINTSDPVAFGRPLDLFTEPLFARYLDHYNISYVITHGPKTISVLNSFDQALTFEKRVGGYHVYRAQNTPSWFLKGSGEVEMDFDRLSLRNVSSGPVVLKFHWVKTLKSDPPLELKPVVVLDDPIPFISFDNTLEAPNIEIKNAGL